MPSLYRVVTATQHLESFLHQCSTSCHVYPILIFLSILLLLLLHFCFLFFNTKIIRTLIRKLHRKKMLLITASSSLLFSEVIAFQSLEISSIFLPLDIQRINTHCYFLYLFPKLSLTFSYDGWGWTCLTPAPHFQPAIPTVKKKEMKKKRKATTNKTIIINDTYWILHRQILYHSYLSSFPHPHHLFLSK